MRSDGGAAATPRHRGGSEHHHTPPRALDPHPPRVLPRPCSPLKMGVPRGLTESPEKRRLATFGGAGGPGHPDRKALYDSHSQRSSQRSSPSATRHGSLGDHKALEAEALAEVRASRDAVRPASCDGVLRHVTVNVLPHVCVFCFM